MSAQTPHLGERKAARAGRWIVSGATLASAGICLSLTPARDIAGMITLFGLAATLLGLHRFGRSGPDQSPADS